MKLLSWMRTIKQNGLIPSKEVKGGLGCLRAQVSSDVQDIRTNSFSFSGSSHDQNAPKAKEELLFDEDGFCGFLATGTLGADPETPKFSALVAEEDVMEEKKEMEKLITEKLNKFLEEYPEDNSSKEVERSNAIRDGESNVCSLQDYDLFRSSTELTKGNNGGGAKKKKSLLSLFKRRQTVLGESYKEKHGTSDVIKKIFQKLHGSSLKTRNDDSMPKKKKDLRKSVQNFRSKVHPVLYTPPRDDHKVDNRRKLDLKILFWSCEDQNTVQQTSIYVPSKVLYRIYTASKVPPERDLLTAHNCHISAPNQAQMNLLLSHQEKPKDSSIIFYITLHLSLSSHEYGLGTSDFSSVFVHPTLTRTTFPASSEDESG